MTPTDTLVTAADTLVTAADTLVTDSIATDSTADTLKALVLTDPAPLHDAHQYVSPQASASWILVGLLLLFAILCFKLRGNPKFFFNLIHDLTDVRERENAFDETVRETSFLTLLNILCAAVGGILIYISLEPCYLTITGPLLCIGAAVAYGLFMPPAYWCVGNVFSDRLHAKMWSRGFLASQSLLGVALLPLAMAALFYPEARNILFLLALLFLIAAKLLFISKGFRIFFTKYSSWVTFLYYLCSLEIVPLILTYALARFLILNYV